jgi:hypothetical protein
MPLGAVHASHSMDEAEFESVHISHSQPSSSAFQRFVG